jgi:hypothetical protein
MNCRSFDRFAAARKMLADSSGDTPMSGLVLELSLVCRDHAARMEVTPSTDGGWDARIVVDGQEIARDYCADWRRVQRLRARMQTWLSVGFEPDSGRRPTAA